MINFLIAH